MDAAKRANERVLYHLRRLGADVSEPCEVEFFIYLPTEEGAYRVAAQLQKEGYDVQVDPAAPGEQWLCFATKTIVPSLDEMNRIGEHFTNLAESYGGNYDGWGTGIPGEGDEGELPDEPEDPDDQAT
jgi:regulator of RNase E activity RraB